MRQRGPALGRSRAGRGPPQGHGGRAHGDAARTAPAALPGPCLPARGRADLRPRAPRPHPARQGPFPGLRAARHAGALRACGDTAPPPPVFPRSAASRARPRHPGPCPARPPAWPPPASGHGGHVPRPGAHTASPTRGLRALPDGRQRRPPSHTVRPPLLRVRPGPARAEEAPRGCPPPTLCSGRGPEGRPAATSAPRAAPGCRGRGPGQRALMPFLARSRTGSCLPGSWGLAHAPGPQPCSLALRAVQAAALGVASPCLVLLCCFIKA